MHYSGTLPFRSAWKGVAMATVLTRCLDQESHCAIALDTAVVIVSRRLGVSRVYAHMMFLDYIGHEKAQICEALQISPGTFKVNWSRLYRRLQLAGRSDCRALIETTLSREFTADRQEPPLR